MLSNCWKPLKTNKYQDILEIIYWSRLNLHMVKILLAERSAANFLIKKKMVQRLNVNR